MKKTVIAFLALTSVLAACEGHQYEPKEPGITVSGEAKFGVKYGPGGAQPHTGTNMTVSMGGSI